MANTTTVSTYHTQFECRRSSSSKSVLCAPMICLCRTTVHVLLMSLVRHVYMGIMCSLHLHAAMPFFAFALLGIVDGE